MTPPLLQKAKTRKGERETGAKQKSSKNASFLFVFLSLTVLVSFASAHLDNGFDQPAGPYLVDVGWTPAAPNAGESVLIAINVLDAATNQPANVSSVWVRLDLKDQVSFAGTFALNKGSTSFTYVFPKAGVWTVTVQTGSHQTSGELWVPGQPPSSESWAWIAVAVLALASAVMAFKLYKN